MSESDTSSSPPDFTATCDADSIEAKSSGYSTSVASFSAIGEVLETTLTVSNTKVFVSWQVDPDVTESRFDGAVLKVNGAVKYILGGGEHTIEAGIYLHRATGYIRAPASTPAKKIYSIIRYK